MEIEILNQEKMDNYNFTKGKWEYLYDGCDHCYDIVSDNSSICSTVSLDRISFDTDKEIEANALLISKAPEMLEKLKECIEILDVKCTDGCVNKTWIDFQNGNGEDIGIEIDRFIKEAKQLIKEATEL